MLPTAQDLDDPDGFVHHEQLDFSELDKMLGEAASGGAPSKDPAPEDPAPEGTTPKDTAAGSDGGTDGKDGSDPKGDTDR